MDFSERNRQDYIQALEEERKKILVFERELPLSIQLVTQAIEVCRQQQMGSEEITSAGPVLEEFIPLRPSYSSSGEEDSLHKNGNNNGSGEIGQERSDKKLDWLRSVQLWNQEPEPPHIGDVLRKPIAVNAKRVGGAFHPFEREKIVRGAAAAAPASSITENISGGGGCGAGEEKEGQSHRKVRRCWLPELHRRFLHALQQLGGSHAATPKQIRELMKVDGLTNDEVKSHLQKYRLHMRRPTTAAVQSSSPQPSQIVLVGGLWVPPPEYTTAAAAQPTADMAGAALNRVYTPVASLPSGLGSEQLQQQNKKLHRSCTGPLKSQGRCNGDDNSDDGERTNSDSSATLSSSQTTTASPPF